MCCDLCCCLCFLFHGMQGMGNLVNACVIIVCLAIFGQAGKYLDPIGSRNVIIVQFAVGAAVALFMAVWRFTRLKESKVRTEAPSQAAAALQDCSPDEVTPHRTHYRHMQSCWL